MAYAPSSFYIAFIYFIAYLSPLSCTPKREGIVSILFPPVFLFLGIVFLRERIKGRAVQSFLCKALYQYEQRKFWNKLIVPIGR